MLDMDAETAVVRPQAPVILPCHPRLATGRSYFSSLVAQADSCERKGHWYNMWDKRG